MTTTIDQQVIAILKALGADQHVIDEIRESEAENESNREN